MSNAKNIRKIFVVVVVLTVVLISWLLYDNLMFRFKSTSPNLSSIATSSTYIDVCVSQPIETVGGVTLRSPSQALDVKIVGKCIRIPLQDLKEGENYNIKIEGIESKWFDNKIPEISFDFTPRYIEFSRLPADQQKAQVDSSNSYQVDDPFLNNVFPIITDTFILDIKNGDDGKTVFLDVTILSEVPDYDNGGRITRVSNDKAEMIYAEVLKLVKDKGGSIDKYIVTYSNDYLNKKY